jgi:Uma2 family endonuclease
MPAQQATLTPRLMTIRDFLAFTETRPKEERWELIEGLPVMSPSAVDYHQIIVGNLTGLLWQHQTSSGASWIVLGGGVGTRSKATLNSLLIPDVMIKEQPGTGQSISDDCLVAIEVLSRSNSKRDQIWRQNFYMAVPNCAHYVTVAQKSREVIVHSRATAWLPAKFTALNESVQLQAIKAKLPMRQIYRNTPHGL